MHSTRPDLESVVAKLSETIPLTGFSTDAEFNSFCRSCVETWRALGQSVASHDDFRRHRDRIRMNGEGIIQTSWGGVDISVREDPKVEKFLVVDGGRHLAYENHTKKEEWMEGRSGLGLLLLADRPGARPRLHALTPGRTIEIRPEHEHCLIALTDLLVFERSLDHLGMDKDLVFLFMPDDPSRN